MHENSTWEIFRDNQIKTTVTHWFSCLEDSCYQIDQQEVFIWNFCFVRLHLWLMHGSPMLTFWQFNNLTVHTEHSQASRTVYQYYIPVLNESLMYDVAIFSSAGIQYCIIMTLYTSVNLIWIEAYSYCKFSLLYIFRS